MSYKRYYHTFPPLFSWNSDIHYTLQRRKCQYRGIPREKKFKISYNKLWNSDILRRKIMNLNDAIIKRINEICEEKGVNVCDASLKGGMSPSALYDLIKGRTKCSKVITIKRFCEGAGITLQEFFDRDYFNDIED